MEKFKISAGTITRAILTFLAFFNVVLEMTGHSIIPVDSEGVSTFISLAFMGATTIVSWWKNNSVTQSAIMADGFMKSIKSGNLSPDTAKEIVNQVTPLNKSDWEV